jgi:hypothetical protein
MEIFIFRFFFSRVIAVFVMACETTDAFLLKPEAWEFSLDCGKYSIIQRDF